MSCFRKTGLLDVYVPDGENEKKARQVVGLQLRVALQHDASTQVFTYENSGSVVGELAVLFRAPRAATVKAP